jgi:hypothetical protein
MAIFKETNFAAEAQQRLAAQQVNLEQTKAALLQGEILTINSGLLRKPNRLQCNLSQRSRGVKLATNRAIVGCCNC